MTHGWLLQNQGLDEKAAAAFRESLAVHGCDDGGPQSGWCQMYLAMIACRAGEAREADALGRQGLAVFHREGSATGELWMLLHLATIASAAGEPERSAVLAGQVERLLRRSGIQLPPAEAAEFDQTHAQIETALGAQGGRAALQRGASLTTEEAIAYALEDASL
jgi:non-specific serine/threonine protein kinase